MDVGLRGNRAPQRTQVLRSGRHSLLPGFEYIVAEAASLWLPRNVGNGGAVVVSNATNAAITVSVDGNQISGIGVAGSAWTDTVAQVLPGGRAVFIRDQWMWRSQGADPNTLTFAYNGTPLSNNTVNPLSAGGILHYFGIIQGGGTWQNPTTGAATVTAAISAVGLGTVTQLSDRVASGQSVYPPNGPGGWFGWRFPRQVRITGFIFQTYSVTTELPRNWRFRAGNTGSLANGQDVSGLTIVDTKLNQTQVSGSNNYFGVFAFASPTWGNTLIWQSAGVDSSGTNYLTAQEVEFFGEAAL